MKLVVDGESYVNFSRVEVATQLNAMSRSFSVDFEMDDATTIPFSKGQKVKISIDDERILTGFIETITIKNKQKERSYTVSGHDKMIDVVQSNLDQFGEIGLTTVAGACRRILKYLGIDAKVIELTKPSPFDPDFEIISPEAEDTAFQFLARIAARRQVLLTSDGDGNMVITQGIGSRVNGFIINRRKPNNDRNNVETMDFVSSDADRFGLYTTEFQQNPGASGGAHTPEQTAGASVALRDEDIRPTRRRAIASVSVEDFATARARATWDANLKRAEGLSYKVKLGTFRDLDGAIWRDNTAPKVQDEFAGINTRMLIKGVQYILDGEGETTKLNFTHSGAFQAELALIEDIDFA